MEFEQLCDMINDILPKSKNIFPESRLSSDLGLCSFDMMLLVFQIEGICGHKISVSTIKKDMNVKELYRLIND